jgi:predicted DNA-binding transcriptional regulator AlpA
MSRAAVVLHLGISEREFYRLIREGRFPIGRERLGHKRLWYTQEDVAWMLWFVKNQQFFKAGTGKEETPVKR